MRVVAAAVWLVFGAVARGSAPAAAPVATKAKKLTLRQHAIAGALARCAAQSAVHPLNVAKTLLQTKGGPAVLSAALREPFSASARNVLFRGLGAQALLSLPNGALNFMAMEGSKRAIVGLLGHLMPPRQFVDLLSASVGTATATFVSLPQSILNDRIMAGAHDNLVDAIRAVGLSGMYPVNTWTATLVAKVPAYSLNWAVYEQLRRLRKEYRKMAALSAPPARPKRRTRRNAVVPVENSPLEDVIIGAIASSLSCCIMIPFDTIKVRMTTNNIGALPYTSVADALRRMLAEEGAMSLYRGLPPRLLSVVPMTAIQFAMYEVAKRRIPAFEAYIGHALSLNSNRVKDQVHRTSKRLLPRRRRANNAAANNDDNDPLDSQDCSAADRPGAIAA